MIAAWISAISEAVLALAAIIAGAIIIIRGYARTEALKVFREESKPQIENTREVLLRHSHAEDGTVKI